MYRPPYTRVDDPALCWEIVDAHPFATLVSILDGEPFATHLPVIRHEEVLEMHVARPNPHAELGGQRATVLFQGPNAYVSPTWYGRPAEHVPTWNYVAVHVAGRVECLDEAESAAAMDRLVERFEATWTVAPPVRSQLARAVQGLRLVPDRVEAKLKLSQNREEADVRRVAEGLRRTEPALATWMRRV